MDGGLTLTAAPTTSSSPSPSLPLRFLLPHPPSQLCLSLAPRRRSSRLSFYPRDPGLHHWDLNRAKVSAHKANPGASFLFTEGFLSKKPSLKLRKPPDPIEGPLAEELLALDRMGSEGAESLGLEEPDLEGTESPGLEKPDGERKPAEKVAKESPDIALRKPTRLEDKVWPRASASDKTGKGVDVKRLDDNLLLRKPVIVSSDIVGDTSNFSSADNSTENDAATTDDNLTSESDQMAASFTSQATLTGEPQSCQMVEFTIKRLGGSGDAPVCLCGKPMRLIYDRTIDARPMSRLLYICSNSYSVCGLTLHAKDFRSTLWQVTDQLAELSYEIEHLEMILRAQGLSTSSIPPTLDATEPAVEEP